MPKLNGFEVLELLGRDVPAVVFVTAYDEYAIRAFEVHAVDYLLKPVSPRARWPPALERARAAARVRTGSARRSVAAARGGGAAGPAHARARSSSATGRRCT